MIFSKKSLLLVFFLAVLVVMLAIPALQGIQRDPDDNEIRFTDDDSIRSLKFKIEKMRDVMRRDGDTFQIEINPAVLVPLDQLCTLKEGLKTVDSSLHEAKNPELNEALALPTSYTGYFTIPKDQMSCGSCWAFSTLGEVEAVILKNTGTTYDLSEQHMLDCNPYGYSCSGGWFAFGMCIPPNYPRLESCYPYVGVKQTCKTSCPSAGVYINNWYYIGTSSSVPTVTNIKNAIYNYGSVSAAVVVNTYFQAYSSGCFSRKVNGSVNHGIVLCGWNDTTPCSSGAWLLKNSWGTSWGTTAPGTTTRGFMWIQYGVAKVGYAACYAVY